MLCPLFSFRYRRNNLNPALGLLFDKSMYFQPVSDGTRKSLERQLLRFTLHPTLWKSEMPMYKGFEASVGCL